MIDDYNQAMALLDQMRAHLSESVYATPPLRKTLRDQQYGQTHPQPPPEGGNCLTLI